jgi:hypothetical protein
MESLPRAYRQDSVIEVLEAVAQTYITTQVADAARFWAEPGADPPRLATEVQTARARRQVRGASSPVPVRFRPTGDLRQR